MTPRTLELLAPARNAAIAADAIACGADAVYMGAPAFGARAAAGNSVEDIRRVVELAHRFNVRVYVTTNTIIYDSELPAVEALVRQLYDAGVDALIVQDMAYLRMNLPPIALHASTQCDTRTPARAAFLEKAGFSQIVLARELTLDEIRSVRAVTTVPLEAFVHGALCVSYSGDCQAGFMATGRSANRGECPQMCRLSYRLTDAAGRDLAPERHYLSLLDMQRIDMLGEMADAGVSSFKIEGRLKDAAYVRTVVAAYSQALDALVSASAGRYRRASSGRGNAGFQPDVGKVFNRGFTHYFLNGGRRTPGALASMASPKHVGRPVGKVKSCRGRRITADFTTELHNGDGLGYFDASGRYTGFRLNRVVDAGTLEAASEVNIRPGTELYRNADKAYIDAVEHACPERTIAVEMELRAVGNDRIALTVTDERGCRAEVCMYADVAPALNSQSDARRRTLERLGGTVYSLGQLQDALGDIFIPASQLTALRRDAIAALDAAQAARYTYDRRRPCRIEPGDLAGTKTTYHDNVANCDAAAFYAAAGAEIVQRAAEVARPAGYMRVMTTRYCLRRELGACLRKPGEALRLPRDLYLRAPGLCYRLEFDCPNCEMHVITNPKAPSICFK